MKRIFICLIFAITSLGLWAQEETLKLQFSDPSKPGSLSASLINGGITLRGHNSADIIVSVPVSARAENQDNEKTNGMRRIRNFNPNLEIEEHDNQAEIIVKSWHNPVNLEILVPYETSITLKCTNEGDILVENIKGEVEVRNVNGAITLKEISGSVVAHSINEDLIVQFAEVNPDKPMSFSSLNGHVDVTFPANLKAKFFLESSQGDIFTAFEMDLNQEIKREESGKNGSRRLALKSQMVGLVGNGGQEISLKTFNGNIYIRKGQ